MSPDKTLYCNAITADCAYGGELYRLFGARSGDVRYTARGTGEPGSELRRLYDAKVAADAVWLSSLLNGAK